MEHINEINRRMESGEFGSPPDFSKVNAAWADLMEEEMANRGSKAVFTSITGLWRRNGNKVAYDGRTQEDVLIPAGTKLLAFHGDPEPGTRQPDLSLVFVTYDE